LFIASGDDPSSRVLLGRLRRALDRAQVPYFTINSFQYLSKLDPLHAKRRRGDAELLVKEKRLGRVFFSPIQRHSALLKKYNEKLDIVNLYVLPENYAAALKAARKVR
jgi:hypothetical protein